MNEQERRRAKRRRRAGKAYRTDDLGNGMERAAPGEVVRAIGALPPDLDWDALAPGVVPILPRRRPAPPAAGEPVRIMLPPGIPTGFGVDIGPALLVVGASLLASWPIGPAELVTTALGNLRRRLRPVRPRDLHTGVIDGIPIRILQSGMGCASTLVLVPDELQRIFGTRSQVLIAPMRDLLVSLPAGTDRAFVGWLNDELATMDPNGLALDAFVLDGGTLRYEALNLDLVRS
jgi:hypothetical protein